MNRITLAGLVAELHDRRLLLALLALTYCGSQIRAGEIALTASTEEVTTAAVSNDDYSGEFADNPNQVVFNSNAFPVANGTIATLEGVFAVLPSGGTSEYALKIGGAASPDRDPPLSKGYRLQVGFGTGDNFVPASEVLEGLDFDAPLPSSPPLQESIGILPELPFGVLLFELASQTSDTIVWSGHDLRPFSSFFLPDLFQVPLDVPDLPASVLEFYGPGELPPDLPAGAGAFTIRGTFVPEPATWLLLAGSLLCLVRRPLSFACDK